MPALPDAVARPRRVGSALAIFAIVLGATTAAELTGDALGYRLALLLIVLGLALDRSWLQRASGKVALALAVATVLGGALLGVEPVRLAAAAAPMSDVVVLMLCIALLRPVFAERQLDQALLALLTRVPSSLRSLAIILAACVTALGLSFGTVGIFGASLARRTSPEQVAPYATMRGLVLSMLLGPSTASVAAVMALYPQVTWGASLTLGLPLVAAGALLGSARGMLRSRQLVVVPGAARNSGGWIAVAVLAVQFAVAILAHTVLDLSMTLSIAVASAAVATGATLWWGRSDLAGAVQRADARMLETWRLIMPEGALFLASGLVVGLMQAPVVADASQALAAAILPPGLWGVVAILIAVPLITAAGIHPIVPFALLSPMVSSAGLGVSEVGLYTTWIVAFMLSMLVSPVSVLTMVTTTNFGISVRLLGLRGHGLYGIGLAAAAAAIVLIRG